MKYKFKKKTHNFWLKRAAENKSDIVCTNDPDLDILESEFLLSKLKKNSQILEIGCGNGLLYEKIRNTIDIKKYLGTDFVQKLIDDSKIKIKHQHDQFLKLDMTEIKNDTFKEKFDFIISKRAIQNVLNSKIQIQVIENLGYFLKKNGTMILIESSSEKQNNINSLRKQYGLQKIKPPFHNLFIKDKDISKYKFKKIKLVKIEPFASDFYFITRIIFARYANEYLNEKPSRAHPLYKIALTMNEKQITTQFSQIQAYIFKRSN